MFVFVHKRAHFCTGMGFITLFEHFRSEPNLRSNSVRISYSVLIIGPEGD